MKNVYIILTQSGTIISRIIKFFTHDKVNHASICLDEKFEKFYSFGRLKINNPLNGGFVTENAFTHVFGKFKYIPCIILKKEVSDEQYEAINNIIEEFINNKEKYKYDFLNLFFAKTSIRFTSKNRFFCSGFVAYVLETAGITIPNEVKKIRPYEFTKLKDSEIIYEGELKEWCKTKINLSLKN